MVNMIIFETPFTLIEKTSTIARTPATRARLKARSEFKSRSSERIGKIDAYRLDFLKQILINKKLDISIREYQIFLLWLVQSHA